LFCCQDLPACSATVQRGSALARPDEVEDADQVNIIVNCEHDEPEVA
jgi:hypothetical protein